MMTTENCRASTQLQHDSDNPETKHDTSPTLPFPTLISPPGEVEEIEKVVKPGKRGRDSSATLLRAALEKSHTALVGDTTDLETLAIHDLHGTTLTPKNVLEQINQNDIFYHVWAAVKRAISDGSTQEIDALTDAAMEQFLVELGKAVMDSVPGPHFTFVDPRLHSDSSRLVEKAKSLIGRFERDGVARSQIVVSIPATEDGLFAARELEKVHSIQTNLILVSGLMHVAACAEAGATAATIPVGPLLEWHEKKRNITYPCLASHPGVEVIQSSLGYIKLHDIKTRLIGAEFRQIGEIQPLGAFDAISLTKVQIEEAQWSKMSLRRAPSDSSPSSLRARQAKYPMDILSSRDRLMVAMSAETRSMVAATLYTILGKMKVEMEQLEKVIREETKRQTRLELLDLKTLYRWKTSKKKRPKKSPARAKVQQEPADSDTRHDEDRRLLDEGIECF